MDLTALRNLSVALAGQASLAGDQLYSTALVDEALNTVGEEMWLEAKELNNGWGRKTVIDNTVDGVEDIALPADFDNRIIKVKQADTGVESRQRLIDTIASGHSVEVDPAAGMLKDLTTETDYQLKPLGEAGQIVAAGGIFEYARKSGLLK